MEKIIRKFTCASGQLTIQNGSNPHEEEGKTEAPLQIINAHLLGKFEPGKEYFLTITESDPGEAQEEAAPKTEE